MIKKLLITGGSGFLGSNLIRLLSSRGYVITAAKHATTPVRMEPCEWVPLDLRDEDALREHLLWNRYDAIVHCAALSKVQQCRDDRKRAFETNVRATRLLADAASMHQSRFIFISTDLVFDGKDGWYSEDDRVNPQSYYAETKCLAEQDVRLVASDYFILRTALMYGLQDCRPGSLLEWMVGAMQRGETANVYINQFRTILFVDDVAEAIDRLLQSSLRNQTYHLAGPERMNRLEMARAVAGAFGFPTADIRPTKLSRPIELGECDDTSLKTDKLRSAIGIEFTQPLAGLARVAERWRESLL